MAMLITVALLPRKRSACSLSALVAAGWSEDDHLSAYKAFFWSIPGVAGGYQAFVLQLNSVSWI